MLRSPAITRFGIGGPADLYAETESPEAFIAAWREARASGIPTVVIGDGTNLIVSDLEFWGKRENPAAITSRKHTAATASVLAYGLAHLRSDLIGCVRLGYV